MSEIAVLLSALSGLLTVFSLVRVIKYPDTRLWLIPVTFLAFVATLWCGFKADHGAGILFSLLLLGGSLYAGYTFWFEAKIPRFLWPMVTIGLFAPMGYGFALLTNADAVEGLFLGLIVGLGLGGGGTVRSRDIVKPAVQAVDAAAENAKSAFHEMMSHEDEDEAEEEVEEEEEAEEAVAEAPTAESEPEPEPEPVIREPRSQPIQEMDPEKEKEVEVEDTFAELIHDFDDLEKQIFQVAIRLGGDVRVTDVSLQTDLSLKQAQNVLERMANKALCRRMTTQTWSRGYRFLQIKEKLQELHS